MNAKSELDLSDTTIAKSDQLNSDDIIGEPITVTITGVSRAGADEQPIAIEITGGWKPWKPCKTMRRILIAAWGKNGTAWVGRSLTLFRDPSVKWAGESVGGIRISHMSHITKPLDMSLAESKKSKKKYIIDVLIPAVTAAQVGAMNKRWIAATKAAGVAATREGFEKFVGDCTAGLITPNQVQTAAEYTPEFLAKCEAAIESMEAQT